MVHVAAEGMANSSVSKGAQRAVEEESVVMKGQEVLEFRQLQNVNTPRRTSSRSNGNFSVAHSRSYEVLVDNLAQWQNLEKDRNLQLVELLILYFMSNDVCRIRTLKTTKALLSVHFNLQPQMFFFLLFNLFSSGT